MVMSNQQPIMNAIRTSVDTISVELAKPDAFMENMEREINEWQQKLADAQERFVCVK